MHKYLKAALILLVATNAFWLLGFATGYFSTGKSPRDIARETATQTGGAGGGGSSTATAKELGVLFSMDDMAGLLDKLRALGLPESVARSIVRGQIRARYEARSREISREAREAALRRPYWRGTPGALSAFNPLENYTPEQLAELRELGRDTTRQLRQLLGDDELPDYTLMRYAFLPLEKITRLQEIEDDYRDLRSQIRDEMGGFRMPGDTERLKLLDEEEQRDKLALMTPEEREGNDLRASSFALRVRRALAGSDITEEEFKFIYAQHNAIDEKYSASLDAVYYRGADQSEVFRAIEEERTQAEARIKEMFGDARYADYQRGQRADYQSLLAAAQRFNLAPETVAQTYRVRESAATEAKRISDDKSLDAAQKAQAYAALAEQATGQIRAALGNDVGDAYIDNALHWLKNLPKGGSVSISTTGDVRVAR